MVDAVDSGGLQSVGLLLVQQPQARTNLQIVFFFDLWNDLLDGLDLAFVGAAR